MKRYLFCNIFPIIFANNKIIYIKYCFLIVIIFLQACSHDLPSENVEVKNIKNFITNLCPLNDKLDTSKDIILATLYYKTNEINFYKDDENILDQVIKLFQSCNNKILILAHNSNKEFNADPILASKISYLRSYNVYNYLKKYIPNRYLYFSFCSNLRNKFIEDNEKAILGNQRVEIIFIGNNINSTIIKYFINNK